MSERFYIETMSTGQSVRIEGPEARHIAKVMRKGPGDQITLFDGKGHESDAVIASVQKNSVEVLATEVREVSRESPLRLIAGVAVPKGDRLKYLVEKMTECGVAALVPLLCTRSNVVPRENTVQKMRRYVIEASKQCGRNTLMEIHDPLPVEPFLTETPGLTKPEKAFRFCCDPNCDQPLSKMDRIQTDESCCLIGPEGGLTNEEIANAISANWLPVSLGSRVLRTETAVIASCITAFTLFQD